jgi:hypothetical protein
MEDDDSGSDDSGSEGGRDEHSSDESDDEEVGAMGPNGTSVASHIPKASCGSGGDTYLCVVCAYRPRNGYFRPVIS